MKIPIPAAMGDAGRPGLSLTFSPLDKSAARKIMTWRYASPYDIYNLEDSDETLQYMLDTQHHYNAMRNLTGDLVGFCSFGMDGQVPGGSYTADALDIGMGLHPDFTGQGHGSDLAAAVLDFAQREFNPPAFRVTIAAFNLRAQRVWEKNGFRLTENFTHKASNRNFIVMVKDGK